VTTQLRQVWYRGSRDGEGLSVVQVIATNRAGARRTTALPLRLELRLHSPAGFEWGYCGRGPAQLALALCAHATGNDGLALQAYGRLHEHLVAQLEVASWELSRDDVLSALDQIAKAVVEARCA
jgi:hypothetical protein